MSRNNFTFQIVLGALLAAISFILKQFLSITTSYFRITLFPIPLIFGGVLMGPLLGGMIGFTTDALYMFTSGYGPSLMTISSIVWGLVPGIIVRRKYSRIRIFITIVITTFLTFSLNTVQLYLWFGPSVYADLPFRFGISLLHITIYTPILILLTTDIRIRDVFKLRRYKTLN